MTGRRGVAWELARDEGVGVGMDVGLRAPTGASQRFREQAAANAAGPEQPDQADQADQGDQADQACSKGSACLPGFQQHC